MSTLPPGFSIALDPALRRISPRLLVRMGSPLRVLRLSQRGEAAFDEMLAGHWSPAMDLLASRLADAEVAFPRPPRATGANRAVSVVVPVRDRPADLDRCLTAIGGDAAVTVVDDGSRDPEATAAVCARHGAALVRLPASRGPAAARNAGLAVTDTQFVALLDSDCVPASGWLDRLTGHFADPRIAAVAPRIRPLAPSRAGSLTRYLAARTPLDMGAAEGLVGHGRRVPYVPSAALVVRRASLGAGFDERLRHGEDVDLVWRLADAGGLVRYVPDVVVRHREPTTFRGALGRRHRYGTSVGPLATRHPGRAAHVVLSPWALTTAALATVGWHRLALVSGAAHVAAAAWAARKLPPRLAVDVGIRAGVEGLAGLGRMAVMLASPAVAAGAASRRARPAVALLATLGPLCEWVARRPALDPLRWSALCLADDIAYGAGVLRGCAAHRTTAPIRPTFRPRRRLIP